MVKVSVLVPIYKVEKYIQRCANSLFAQTLDAVEYIFVDDCSPDKSVELLIQTLAQYPHRTEQVKIMRNETNKGLSYTRKVALLEAKGEFVAICDSDDWVEPNMYELLYNKAIAQCADIVCCNFYREYGKGIQKEEKYEYEQETEEDLIKLKLIGGKYSAWWNKLIRTRLIKTYNILPVEGINMWEDFMVTFRLRFLASKIIILPMPLYHYNCVNQQSISANYSISKTQQKIEVAQYMERFICEQGVREVDLFSLAINNIKFLAKAELIKNPESRDYLLWKNTFRESNRYVWKYTNISFPFRLFYWFSVIHLPHLSFFCFDFGRMIRNTLLTHRSEI